MDKGKSNKNKNKSKNENDEVINPLDFFDLYLKEEAEAAAETRNVSTKSFSAFQSVCKFSIFSLLEFHSF